MYYIEITYLNGTQESITTEDWTISEGAPVLQIRIGHYKWRYIPMATIKNFDVTKK